jgi:hypothetical protein
MVRTKLYCWLGTYTPWLSVFRRRYCSVKLSNLKRLPASTRSTAPGCRFG